MKFLLLAITFLMSFSPVAYADTRKDTHIPVNITKISFLSNGSMMRWKAFDLSAVGAVLKHSYLGSHMPSTVDQADFLFGIFNDTQSGPFIENVLVSLITKNVYIRQCSSDHCDYGKHCVPHCWQAPGAHEKLEVDFRGVKFFSEEKAVR